MILTGMGGTVMLKQLTLVIAILILSSNNQSAAQTPLRNFLSGNDLLSKCKDEQSIVNQQFCNGYVVGTADVLQSFQSVGGTVFQRETAFPCFPKGITSEQLVDIVTKDLEESPERRHAAASQLVIVALVAAFPCPTGE